MGESKRREAILNKMSPAERNRRAMQEMSKHLDQTFNGDNVTAETRQVGFVLLAFPLKPYVHASNQVANTDRLMVMKVLRDQLDYLERLSSNPAGGVTPTREQVDAYKAALIAKHGADDPKVQAMIAAAEASLPAPEDATIQ